MKFYTDCFSNSNNAFSVKNWCYNDASTSHPTWRSVFSSHCEQHSITSAQVGISMGVGESESWRSPAQKPWIACVSPDGKATPTWRIGSPLNISRKDRLLVQHHYGTVRGKNRSRLSVYLLIYVDHIETNASITLTPFKTYSWLYFTKVVICVSNKMGKRIFN